MSKKTSIILIVAMIAIVVWGVRVYNVNAGVAKAYDIKTYQMGQAIPLDNATFKVTQISYGDKKKDNGYVSVPLLVKMEVKNTSDKSIPMLKIIEAKLAYGMDYYQTRDGEFDVGKLRDLPPHATTKVTLKYDVKPKWKGKSAKLYLDQTLYRNRVRAEFDKGKRLGISVSLSQQG